VAPSKKTRSKPELAIEGCFIYTTRPQKSEQASSKKSGPACFKKVNGFN